MMMKSTFIGVDEPEELVKKGFLLLSSMVENLEKLKKLKENLVFHFLKNWFLMVIRFVKVDYFPS